MTVIFCGSRDWKDRLFIGNVVDHVARKSRGKQGDCLLIVSGGARGADSLSVEEARSRGIECHELFADWLGRGRGAGPERNRRMLALNPDSVYAFKDGFDWTLSRGGTEHMVKIALEAGVKCHVRSNGAWRTLETT